jgi:peptidoglycan hydrolase-like protein with peptidoglycan-binding domain
MSVAMTAGGGAALAASGSSTLLHSGSQGSTIVAVQRALGITADGVYGSATRRAVMEFQRGHGLIVDGIVGPQTLGALGLRSGQDQSSSSTGTSSSELEKIAQCESSGNPGAVSPDGTYRGKYQFSRETWRELGGSGDPASAPEGLQDTMAAKLMAVQGASAWPNCA